MFIVMAKSSKLDCSKRTSYYVKSSAYKWKTTYISHLHLLTQKRNQYNICIPTEHSISSWLEGSYVA